MSFFKRLRLLGREYIFVDGAIATESAYEAGEVSFAHLCEDGKVRRFGYVIADESDIEWLPVSVEVIPEVSEFLGGFRGGSWRGNRRSGGGRVRCGVRGGRDRRALRHRGHGGPL